MLLDEFNDCVPNAWGPQVHGNPFFVFSEKLKRLKRAMIELNSSTGNLSTSVRLAKDDLHQVQTLLHHNPLDNDLLEQEKNSIQLLWTVMDREEMLLQQKSRASWLSLGDKNSKFFSNMMNNRWNSNKIYSIQDKDGNLVNGQKAVESVAVDFFQHLLNSHPDQLTPALVTLVSPLLILLALIKQICYLPLSPTWKFIKFSPR